MTTQPVQRLATFEMRRRILAISFAKSTRFMRLLSPLQFVTEFLLPLGYLLLIALTIFAAAADAEPARDAAASTATLAPTISAACRLSAAAGSCGAAHQRWYFDATLDQCREFVFSGCHGNANNFNTLADCEEACLGLPERCRMMAITGPCRRWQSRWYYDTKTAECTEFFYGGCVGNENNFATRSECESTCSRPTASAIVAVSADTTPRCNGCLTISSGEVAEGMRRTATSQESTTNSDAENHVAQPLGSNSFATRLCAVAAIYATRHVAG